MSFGDVVQSVVDITARADKVTLIKSTINTQIRYISGLGRFPQNLEDVVDNNSLNSNLVTVALPNRFQAVSYVRPESCTEPLDAVSPATYRQDQFGYYITGSNMLVRMEVNSDKIYIGWYKHPNKLVNDSDSNWLLDAMESIIIEMASYKIQGLLGNQAAANSLERYSLQFIRNELDNYVSPYGD